MKRKTSNELKKIISGAGVLSKKDFRSKILKFQNQFANHESSVIRKSYAKDDELEIKPWNKNGKHIVVIPPSWWLCKNLGWNPTKVLQDTIDELKKHTDREIRVRVKKVNGNYNTVPLHEDMKNAHAVVSFQSSASRVCSSVSTCRTLGTPQEQGQNGGAEPRGFEGCGRAFLSAVPPRQALRQHLRQRQQRR